MATRGWLSLAAAALGWIGIGLQQPADALPTTPTGFAGHLDRAIPGPVLPVRDVCSRERKGSTVTTFYCDDGMVCDGEKKCKPGPELQRKLDAERRQAEERLKTAERDLRRLLRRERESGPIGDAARRQPGFWDPKRVPSDVDAGYRLPQSAPGGSQPNPRTAGAPPTASIDRTKLTTQIIAWINKAAGAGATADQLRGIIAATPREHQESVRQAIESSIAERNIAPAPARPAAAAPARAGSPATANPPPAETARPSPCEIEIVRALVGSGAAYDANLVPARCRGEVTAALAEAGLQPSSVPTAGNPTGRRLPWSSADREAVGETLRYFETGELPPNLFR